MQPALPADAQILGLRRAGPLSARHAVGEAGRLRAQPWPRRRGGSPGPPHPHPAHARRVPPVPHHEPRHRLR